MCWEFMEECLMNMPDHLAEGTQLMCLVTSSGSAGKRQKEEKLERT